MTPSSSPPQGRASRLPPCGAPIRSSSRSPGSRCATSRDPPSPACRPADNARRCVPRGTDCRRRALPRRNAVHGALRPDRRRQDPLRCRRCGNASGLHPRSGRVAVRLAQEPRPGHGRRLPSRRARPAGIRLLRQAGTRLHEHGLRAARRRADGLPAPPRRRAGRPLDGRSHCGGGGDHLPDARAWTRPDRGGRGRHPRTAAAPSRHLARGGPVGRRVPRSVPDWPAPQGDLRRSPQGDRFRRRPVLRTGGRAVYISSTIWLRTGHLKPKLGNTRALRIIAAARDEFAQHGFEGARVDQIAQRAGVNKQLLFYYFHSKRGLFNAVLTRGAAELEQALASLAVAGDGPLDRIAGALAAQFDFLAAHPELVTLLTQAGRSDARPFAPAIKRLVILLAEGQGRGQVRDDVDPHLAAAQALVLMVAYLGLESLIAASAPALGSDEPALSRRWKDAAVRLVLEGVAAR